MSLSLLLVFLLVLASACIWVRLIPRLAAKRAILEPNDEQRSAWNTAHEYTAIYVASIWVLMLLASSLSKQVPSETKEFSLQLVAIDASVSLVIVVLLPLIVYAGGTPLSSIGIKWTKFLDQVKLGLIGYIAAILPMAISMLVTVPIRPVEDQHQLLKRLSETPNITTIAFVAGLAVIAAPLKEEMVFRVILQGWLRTFIPRAAAISIVAVLFSLVHGWRNGLALLPLALILGYVFDRRNSYVAVVVVHALFNLTMLVLHLLDLRT